MNACLGHDLCSPNAFVSGVMPGVASYGPAERMVVGTFTKHKSLYFVQEGAGGESRLKGQTRSSISQES